MKTHRFLCTFIMTLAVSALTGGCAPDRDRRDTGLGREAGERATPGQAPQVRDSRSDAAITADVKAQLAMDEGLASLTEISVTTNNGAVTLSGNVDTAQSRSRAEGIARGVDGVDSVINNLRSAQQ